MAIIKDLSIDFVTGEVTVLVELPEGIVAVYFMPDVKGQDGGPELLEAAKGITAYTKNFLYYHNGKIVDAGLFPEFYKWDWATLSFKDTRTLEDMWEEVRRQRNRLLIASDWTQLPDVPLATKEAWAAYRQQLRDVTLQPDPFNIVWPTQPQ